MPSEEKGSSTADPITPATDDDTMSDNSSNKQLSYLLGGSALSCVALVACIVKEKKKQMENEGGSKEMRKLYKNSVKKEATTMKENLV